MLTDLVAPTSFLTELGAPTAFLTALSTGESVKERVISKTGL